MTRPKNMDYLSISPVEMYYMVLDKKFSKFPNGYLDKQCCKEILRHIVIDKLHMSREEICESMSLPFLRKYHISTFRKFWDTKIHLLVEFCFPEMEIHPWELKRVSNDYWKSKENCKKFLLWMAEKERLDLTKLEDVRKIKATTVQRYGGIRALRNSGGLYPLICLATGDTIKEWELDKVNVWTEEKAIRAVKWLIEKRLQWTDEQVYKNLTAKVFEENCLDGLLGNFCNNSPIKAIQLAYPGKYKTLANSKSP